MKRALPGLLFLSTVCLLSCGCSVGSGTGNVKGTITVGGHPIKRGLITFLSEVGNHDVFNAAIVDGNFETSEIPCGLCKIVIIPTSSNPQGAGGSDLIQLQPGNIGPSSLVPAQYQTAETTPLTLEIKKGSNEFNQDLEP